MNKTDTKYQHINTVSDETILKISKEIAVKFIETGRLTPDSFKENFPQIFTTIKSTIKN